jgi:hypothetical protein
MSSAISAAFTAAQTNVGLVAAGLVTLAAVVTGVGLIYRLLAR